MGDLPPGGGDIPAILHNNFGMHGLSPGDNVDEEDATPQKLNLDAFGMHGLSAVLSISEFESPVILRLLVGT